MSEPFQNNLLVLFTTFSFISHYLLLRHSLPCNLILYQSYLLTLASLLHLFYLYASSAIPTPTTIQLCTASWAFLDTNLLPTKVCKAQFTILPAYTLLSISLSHFPFLANVCYKAHGLNHVLIQHFNRQSRIYPTNYRVHSTAHQTGLYTAVISRTLALY
jgi:hypothetical protein